MREIVKIKRSRMKRMTFFLTLLISSYLVKTPVLAHTPESLQSRERIEIRGVVKDVQGEIVIGATVRAKSNQFAGATTGLDGDFTLYVSSMDDVLLFNYVGMQQKEVPLKAGTTFYNVVMELSKDTQLKDIVVEAGIVQHNKLGFTGSVTTVTREELKSIGSVQILQSLKAFDPAFNLMDNMQFGSNPNVMATIEIRGQTTLDLNTVQDEANINPNAPLFILDGFESTLEEINDLNVNMIESITILKDAGSTAIYGAKGGNGVIIIETIKPEGGKVMVRYDGTLQIAAPDLSVYNMMNATEKLEFERLAGRYGAISETEGLMGQQSELYYQRLREVKRGVDTYWLAEPVRTGITNTHTATVTGGDRNLLFLASLSYRNIQGVIKDSDRESYTGKVNITYRPTSRFHAQNTVTLQGTNSYTGAWGSFQNFVNASPYLLKRDEEGNIPRVIETYRDDSDLSTYTAYNPLYNSTLQSKNENKTFIVRNNTALDWFVNDDLRLKGTLGLYRETYSSEVFKDPDHTDYSSTDYTKQGSYTGKHYTKWSYDANINLIYVKTFLDGHMVSFTGRTALKESNYTSESFVAEGFPIGAPMYPEYAYSYKENSRPSYSKTVNREVSFLGALNYNYQYRYLLDLSINREGSNHFGNKNKFQTFGSVGLGWNLHKELFTEDWDWLTFFKVRGSYGTNAVQTFGATTSSVYKYQKGYNVFGLGSYLASFGNPDFQWQKVEKTTVGLESQFLDNRFGLKFEIFQENTNPQAVNLPVKSSSGMTSYPLNMGWVKSKGLEFMLSVTPIKNLQDRIILNLAVNGTHFNSKYGGFSDSLNQLNDEFLSIEDNTISNLQKYEDGRSPYDMWAVRSLGIDPATGREIFLDENDNPTYIYNAKDRRVIANTNPDLRGAFLVNFTYRKFSLNLSLYYAIGGYKFNTALFNKVENITGGQVMYNQDKRALYDRWQKPGDIAQFRSISLSQSTNISSRFIQKDSYLQGQSIQVRWDFSQDKWIKKIGMQDLSISANMNDMFTWSTMKVERGTEYPFQRSFSINLSTRF